MTPGEFREIVKTMKDFGVSHVKMGDLELTMEASRAEPAKASISVPVEAPAESSDPIKHKVEQMTSLLKLSDQELVDTLFPDHTQQDNAEESA